MKKRYHIFFLISPRQDRILSNQIKIRKLSVLFFVFLLFFTGSNCLAQPITEWVRSYPDTNNFQADIFDMALDDSGNVLITGFTEDNNPVLDGYCTIKYSSTGVQKWIANYYSNTTGGRYSRAIAIDKAGIVFITGDSFETGRYFDYCTIKYNSNGVQQWIRYFDDSFHGDDEGEKIAIDSAGNIYVSGYSQMNIGGYAITTIKYSTNGDELWVKSYGTGEPVAYVKEMITDKNCNIYLTGDYNSALTLKYDSSGTLLWAQQYGYGQAQSNSLAIDKFDNVYITGEFDINSSKIDLLTIKYSDSGTEQWVRRFEHDSLSSYFINIGLSEAVDNSGNLCIAGISRFTNSSPVKPVVIKYSYAGVLLWINLEADFLGLAGPYLPLTIDKNDNIYIYISGCIPLPPEVYSITTIKYDSSGIRKWLNFDHSGSSPTILKVDKNFNIYIGGHGNSPQMCTIKYSQLPIGIIRIQGQVPTKFKLYQNYPNPFNPSTKIKFDIPANSSPLYERGAGGLLIKLTIYDISGREVETLVNKILAPGEYEVDWDGKNHSSGYIFIVSRLMKITVKDL